MILNKIKSGLFPDQEKYILAENKFICRRYYMTKINNFLKALSKNTKTKNSDKKKIFNFRHLQRLKKKWGYNY